MRKFLALLIVVGGLAMAGSNVIDSADGTSASMGAASGRLELAFDAIR